MATKVRPAQESTAIPPSPKVPEHRNEVVLVGRVSSALERREMPSGDVVGMLRIVVERGRRSRYRKPGSTRAAIDAIDCAAWSPPALQAMEHWQVGDLVEVGGALRRRYQRTGRAVISRYEVEVFRGRRLACVRRFSRRRSAGPAQGADPEGSDHRGGGAKRQEPPAEGAEHGC